jgi:Holliday junction resolvase-like predicted endonuclease
MIGEEQLRSIRHFWNNDSRKGLQQIEVEHRWPASLLQNIDRKVLGRLGENIVSKWAQLLDFKVLYRSLRHTGFELDLVLQRNSSINVLEIKTRLNPLHAPDMNTTQGWMNERKKNAIVRGLHFLSESLPDGFHLIESVSVDLVAIDIEVGSKKIRAYRWPNILNI